MKNKGFSLFELVLVLAVGSSMSFLKFQDLKNEQENILASATGQQIKQIGMAVNSYINIHYDKLSTLKSVSTATGTDPGPRTCYTVNNTCAISYSTLVNEGLLPSSFTGINPNKSTYTIILKRQGISPNYIINGIITTNKAWEEGNKIRYDLLGKAMQSAGIDSGMSKSSSILDGYSGTWTAKNIDYSNIDKPGILGYRVGYDSAMYSIYLRRDGTLPMTGDLNMGTKSINNAQNITASGIVTSGILKSTGDTLVGSNLSVSGQTTLTGMLQVNNSINSTNNITASGNVNAGNWVWARNGYGDVIGFGGDSHADDYEIVMSKDKPLSIHMGSNRSDLTTLKITGGLESSGNITSYQNVYANYLKTNSVAIVGAACSEIGLISKDSSGNLLSCVNGIWSTTTTLPVGSPIAWPSQNIPNGWLLCNGQTFNKALYPLLARAYPSGYLPDLRGAFIRGLDNGRGLDSGRGVLTYQDDQIQNITGHMPADIGQSGYIGKYVGGAFADSGELGSGDQGSRSGEVRKYTFDASRVVRAGNETRPKNVSFNYIVQAR